VILQQNLLCCLNSNFFDGGNANDDSGGDLQQPCNAAG
jgi:hypothetical protein